MGGGCRGAPGSGPMPLPPGRAMLSIAGRAPPPRHSYAFCEDQRALRRSFDNQRRNQDQLGPNQQKRRNHHQHAQVFVEKVRTRTLTHSCNMPVTVIRATFDTIAIGAALAISTIFFHKGSRRIKQAAYAHGKKHRHHPQAAARLCHFQRRRRRELDLVGSGPPHNSRNADRLQHVDAHHRGPVLQDARQRFGDAVRRRHHERQEQDRRPRPAKSLPTPNGKRHANEKGNQGVHIAIVAQKQDHPAEDRERQKEGYAPERPRLGHGSTISCRCQSKYAAKIGTANPCPMSGVVAHTCTK